MTDAQEEHERAEIRRAADKQIRELDEMGLLAKEADPVTGKQVNKIEKFRGELEADALKRLRANRRASRQ